MLTKVTREYLRFTLNKHTSDSLRLLPQNPGNTGDEWKLGVSWTATDVYKAVTSCEETLSVLAYSESLALVNFAKLFFSFYLEKLLLETIKFNL